MVGRAALKESVALEECTTELLKSKYNLAPVHITKYGIGWDTQTDRLAIPVEDFRGERLGVVLRSLSGQQPKTLTHTEQGAISWFINPHTTSLIIVEDQFSAIRASDFMSSAALLGTHLNDERIQEIKASGLSPVYLALDADAWGKTIKYVSTYRSQLRMIPVQLEKDIKDMTDEELTCLVSSL
jgi:DNA primase